MEQWYWLLVVMALTPICDGIRRQSSEEDRKPVREDRRIHYHTKRHMLPGDLETKKRLNTPGRSRDVRKKLLGKPSGHLTPLKEDEIDNDEVVSVAIGPPPMRPMYDKINWKLRSTKNTSQSNIPQRGTNGAVSIVKDVLTQIGREFLNHQVNEDFVFGQYVGQAMKNISSDIKLQFQHDVLELVIKYQKLSRGELVTPKFEEKKDSTSVFKDGKDPVKFPKLNDTDETWPEFTNLAKFV